MRTKFYKIFGTFPLAWKFKLLLLTKNTTANTRGADLSNYTSDLPVENTYFNTYLRGQLWTVEPQCKVATGNADAFPCIVYVSGNGNYIIFI